MNTNARSQELNTIAAEIAARENVNPFNPPTEYGKIIDEIIDRSGCRKATAMSVWNRWIRRNRRPQDRQKWNA